jgi:hypothetical protein
MTQDAVAGRLAAGQAQALLPEGVPGPVRVDDQWWVVPIDGEVYEPVADPALAARLDANLLRFAAARAAVAAAVRR